MVFDITLHKCGMLKAIFLLANFQFIMSFYWILSKLEQKMIESLHPNITV